MSIAIVTKRVVERFSIGLQFIAPDLEPNEEIVDVETSVSPVEVGGLELYGPPTIDVDVVSQIIQGGIDKNDYKVTFLVTTSAGHIYEEAICVHVRETTSC